MMGKAAGDEIWGVKIYHQQSNFQITKPLTWWWIWQIMKANLWTVGSINGQEMQHNRDFSTKMMDLAKWTGDAT
jgi:hypothetical protein